MLVSSASSYMAWVEDWFGNPGSSDTPRDDRKLCFIAVVYLMSQLVNSDSDIEVLKKIHNLLTYLLLGLNPITNWEKISDYPEPTDTESELPNVDIALSEVKAMMDFSRDEKNIRVLPILGYMTNICKQFKKRDVSFKLGERVSNLMLSSWMVCKSINTPTDVGLIRACLDLYYRSKMLNPTNVDNEYASLSSPMKMLDWYEKQATRLIILNETEQLNQSVSYMSWFCSLIRAQRMTKCLVISLSESLVEDIDEIVEDEVEHMKDVLDQNSLRFTEDNTMCSSHQLFTKLFMAFKMRPPKVKIRTHKS